MSKNRNFFLLSCSPFSFYLNQTSRKTIVFQNNFCISKSSISSSFSKRSTHLVSIGLKQNPTSPYRSIMSVTLLGTPIGSASMIEGRYSNFKINQPRGWLEALTDSTMLFNKNAEIRQFPNLFKSEHLYELTIAAFTDHMRTSSSSLYHVSTLSTSLPTLSLS